ncbi:hypothetical protein [Thalassotalea agarivorans]|nr:hypothetical protein [Thalassotalea agarivorans]
MKAKSESLDYLVWGKYCGECVDNCATMHRIDADTYKVDTTDSFFAGKPFDYVFKGQKATKEEWTKHSWVFSIVFPSLKENEVVYGEPDAYDQCGVYLSYSLNGNPFKVLIDLNNKPEEFKEIISALFEGRQQSK